MIDPEALYTALSSGTHKYPDGTVRSYYQGKTYRGDDPRVVTFPDRFELAPEDTLRRQQAAILALLAVPTPEAPEPVPRPTTLERASRSGPRPSTTREAVEQMRQRLEKDGKPSGERAVAEALGVARGAVRYAMGKDRR